MRSMSVGEVLALRAEGAEEHAALVVEHAGQVVAAWLMIELISSALAVKLRATSALTPSRVRLDLGGRSA